MIFLTGCCAFTSQDCGCKPPDPALDEETLKWIAPYDSQAFFIFEDSAGNKDTLQIVRASDTEFCGGDECGSDCQVEIGALTSRNNPDLKFTIAATLIKELRINNREEIDNQIFAEIDVLNESIFPENDNITTSIIDDFEWNDENIKVLKIKCEDGLKCFDYEMSEFVVSRDFGLIKYLAKDGTLWEKVN